jgi:hypothetical protein
MSIYQHFKIKLLTHRFLANVHVCKKNGQAVENFKKETGRVEIQF